MVAILVAESVTSSNCIIYYVWNWILKTCVRKLQFFHNVSDKLLVKTTMKNALFFQVLPYIERAAILVEETLRSWNFVIFYKLKLILDICITKLWFFHKVLDKGVVKRLCQKTFFSNFAFILPWATISVTISTISGLRLRFKTKF